ncbi:MAG TPA: hypothetical protein VN328_02145 [Thermodesulfovibrionales bacterium]|nr:hypothetical protein [Thermodesulfovibrionales bacterium]
MSRKLTIGLLSLAAVVTLLFLLRPSDERRIKKLFKEGVNAVESKDLDGIMSKFSYNYRDDYGMTYIYLRETLKRELEKLSDIRVEYENLHVTISKDGTPGDMGAGSTSRAMAEADVRVLATMGQETGFVVGDPKVPVHLKFTLEKERMNWRVVKTEGFRQ